LGDSALEISAPVENFLRQVAAADQLKRAG